jgi:hypothetical protein
VAAKHTLGSMPAGTPPCCSMDPGSSSSSSSSRQAAATPPSSWGQQGLPRALGHLSGAGLWPAAAAAASRSAPLAGLCSKAARGIVHPPTSTALLPLVTRRSSTCSKARVVMLHMAVRLVGRLQEALPAAAAAQPPSPPQPHPAAPQRKQALQARGCKQPRGSPGGRQAPMLQALLP